jgi:hypothetical protein
MSRVEWTARIALDGGRAVYAGRMYEAAFDTFGVEKLDHARTFATEADALAWITRLKIRNAQAVKLRNGKIVDRFEPESAPIPTKQKRRALRDTLKR